MNVRIEHRDDRNTLSGNFFKDPFNKIGTTLNKIENDIGVTRIYNPLGTNTLAEVGVATAGGHLVRHGLTPVMEDSDKYFAVVKSNNDNNANRLVALLKQFSEPTHDADPIAQYKGGPGSSLGIGETTIYKANGVNTLTRFDDTELKKSTLLQSFIPMTMKNIQTIEDGVGKIDNITTGDDNVFNNPDTFNFRTKDFREYKNKIKTSDQRELPSTDYEKLNMHDRIGTARARRPDEYQPDYSVPVKGSSDKINALGLYYSDKPYEGTAYTSKNDAEEITRAKINDLVKLRIKALDNDKSNYGVYMVFRAFLSDINRRIDARWKEFSYVGRGESFYTYDGFSNIMSFEFVLAAHSRLEMKPMYQKLNYLYSTLTPDYRNNKMRGNLVELTIGDYIKYQPGIITSMYVGVPTEANWDIAINELLGDQKRDKDMHELPMILKCGITFIPLYDFLPSKSAEMPFFGIDNRESGQVNLPKDWTTGMNALIKNKKL